MAGYDSFRSIGPVMANVIATGLRTFYGGAVSAPNFRSWPQAAGKYVNLFRCSHRTTERSS